MSFCNVKTATATSYIVVVVVVFSFLLPAIISGPRACLMRPSALPVYNFRRRGVGGLVGTAGVPS